MRTKKNYSDSAKTFIACFIGSVLLIIYAKYGI